MDQDKAPVSGSWHFYGLQVGKTNVTDVHGTLVLGTDFFHLTLHKYFHPATGSEGLLAERGAHYETRADSNDLKLLILR